MHDRLEVPLQLSGHCIERDDGVAEQIVAFAIEAVVVAGGAAEDAVERAALRYRPSCRSPNCWLRCGPSSHRRARFRYRVRRLAARSGIPKLSRRCERRKRACCRAGRLPAVQGHWRRRTADFCRWSAESCRVRRYRLRLYSPKPSTDSPVVAFSAISLRPAVTKIRAGMFCSPGQYVTPRFERAPAWTGRHFELPDFFACRCVESEHAIFGRQIHHAVDDEGRYFGQTAQPASRRTIAICAVRHAPCELRASTTFAALICLSGENRVPARSWLNIGQSVAGIRCFDGLLRRDAPGFVLRGVSRR